MEEGAKTVNDVTIFNFDGADFRVIIRDGQPWFVAKDVLGVLDLNNVTNALRNLDEDERGLQILNTLGGPQEMTVITESGLYALIMRSNKPEARRFRKCPKTGSDGSGYRIAERLGHRVIKPLPALVQLVSDCACCKSMAGVRSVGTVKVTADGKEIASDTGEIQYTDYGISGIPVFQVSRYAVRALDEGADVKAVIDMFPGLSHEQLREYIEKQYEIAAHKTIEDFFGGLINKKLVSAAAKTAGVDGFTKVYKTDMDVLTGIACSMKTFVVNITGYKGFDNGQICQGGVNLSEISAKTCQSKICPGVYFAGEILDVDGPCGGYNLQWAWSSGYVAGMAASERAMNGEINHEC